MTEILLAAVAGLAVGFLMAHLFAEKKHESELARLQVAHETRVKDLQLTEERLRQEFASVAGRVLDESTKKLETHAQKDLTTLSQKGTLELDQRKSLIDSRVEEMRKELKTATDRIALFEKERVDHYSRIEQQMKSLHEQERRLIDETTRLKTALTTSQSVRGRWGELVLRNILKQSELVEGVDFEEQHVTSNDEGQSLKPDFLLRLPRSDQHLVIDAKTSLYESYLDQAESLDEEKRRQGQLEYVKKLRQRIDELASKDYQKHVSQSVPYVVLFVPGEAAIRAAFEADTELFSYAASRKVFLASPSTILPLILLVAQAWRQHRFSEEAHALSKTVQQLGERLERFVGRLDGVRKGLESASRSWNDAIDKSWSGSQGVLRTLERARDQGAALPGAETLELGGAPHVSANAVTTPQGQLL